ncbi:MAG: S9 family peptidase [Candidatus Hydrogenedentes bacterium]|nr:S9 family peptidase [Candidatus Hydrogenedentota bacterium]
MARKMWRCRAASVMAGLLFSVVARAESISPAFPALTKIKGTLVSFDVNARTGRLALLYTSWRGGLWMEIVDGRTGDRLGGISASHAPTTPRFSPDGETLLFVDTVGNIHALDLRAQTTKLVLADKAFESVFPCWDPAGRSIVYYQRPRNRSAGMVTHLHKLDIASSQAEQLTDDPAALDIAPVWSPDGKHILFQRTSGAGPKRVRNVCVLDVATKEVRPLLPDEPGDSVVSQRHWSPDGQQVLVVKTQSGKGATSDTGTVRLMRLGEKSAIWFIEQEGLEDAAFLPDGSAVLGVMENSFLWIDAANGEVTSRFDLVETGPCKREVSGPALGFEGDGRDVVFLSAKGTVYRVKLGGPWAPLIAPEPEPLPQFEQDEYVIESQDGFRVPVKRFAPAKPKRVAVMLVVGGPGAPIDPTQDSLLPLLLEAGYEVVAPVYRGCGGYGPDHLAANRGEWGRADVWDVVAAGKDWKQRFGKDRPLALVGYSYGGYLALLSIARDDAPWVAGVTLWGMVSLQQPLLGMVEAGLPAESGARDRALAERSPIRQATHIRRPLLILHGALDGAANMGEVNALHDQAALSELAVYENDGHGLFLNRGDMMRRLTEFLAKAAGAE